MHRNTRIIVEGYGDMTEEVAVELALLEKANRDRAIALAPARQAAIWRANQGEGVIKEYGAQTLQVHESIYAAWESQLGPECWRDAGFRKWFHRKFPQCRVKSKSGRLSLNFSVPAPAHRRPDSSPAAGVILDARGKTAA